MSDSRAWRLERDIGHVRGGRVHPAVPPHAAHIPQLAKPSARTVSQEGGAVFVQLRGASAGGAAMVTIIGSTFADCLAVAEERAVRTQKRSAAVPSRSSVS